MAFLENIARKFLREYGRDVFKIAFVFPTRRARLYFRKYLLELKEPGTALWTPPIYSIGDFIERLSERSVADDLDLIFQLFSIYQEHVGSYPKKFEEFYPWGKMILSDFDEMDKYLVDTGELFTILKEFKEVEDFAKDEKADIYNKYTGFWESIGLLYRHFNQVLTLKNKAYQGMVYREVAENIKAIASEEKSRLHWKKVIFCGFNALSKAEETIIKHLLDKGTAEIYWDMDRYFAGQDRQIQEAGRFFRKNKKTLDLPKDEKEIHWVEDRLWEPKTIRVIGVQSKVSQAKMLGVLLEKLQRESGYPENVAVVLPDESLLFPTLNSLPKEVSQVNVTIGFPLAQTPVYSLMDSVMEMQLRAADVKRVSKDEEFYYKDIRRVLNHPYVKLLAPEEIDAFTVEIKNRNLIYLKATEIPVSSEPLQRIFRLRIGAVELMDFFLEFLDGVRAHYREHEPDLFPVDYEYMYHFYTLMSRLRDSLLTASQEAPGLTDLDAKAFRQLVTDIMQNTRIPFTGEPLVGLQIMGMLETQTLDFDHIYVLSLNEGHLPPGKAQQSLIPYEYRQKVKMPTYEDSDAIAAYHFYRLLKNSKNVTLFYVTEVKGFEKSEKSRFVEQMLIEFPEENKNARVEHEIMDFTFDAGGKKAISVRKTGEIVKQLKKMRFSASSLLKYLSCPLQFYLSYVLRLREEEEVYESPDYRLIGTIVHGALETLYKPFMGSGKTVTVKDIETLEMEADKAIISTYREELEAADLMVGRNRLVYEVMSKFLSNLFIREKERSGFRVELLEKEIRNIPFIFPLNGKKITAKLDGVIDRVDMTADGVYCIIDYKTGSVSGLNIGAKDDLSVILSGKEAVNRKAMFQLFFYRYLLKCSGGYEGKYRLGIYSFKDMKRGLKQVTIEKKETIVPEEMLDLYKAVLAGIFREIFDESKEFTQTTDETQCGFCPFTNICNREKKTFF